MTSVTNGILPAKRSKKLRLGEFAVGSDEAFISISNYNHVSLFVSSTAPSQYGEIEISLPDSAVPKLRPLLRDADWLLETGGVLKIHTTSSHAKHEAYRILSERFLLTITDDDIIAKKLADKKIPEYGNSKWSICVVSGGNNENKLEKVIESVSQAEFADVELLIVGPKPKLQLPEFARHIDFTESELDPRFPIVEKKNLCARLAKFDNLLIIHDRFWLSPSWAQAILSLRADWDVLVFPVRIADKPELSLQDWCAYSNDSRAKRGSETLFNYHLTYPFNYKNLRHHSLELNEYDNGVMSCGGSFAVRKEILLQTPIDSRLRWAEIEDGDWSERLIAKGNIISLAPTAQLYTRSDWKNGTRRWGSIKFQRTYLKFKSEVRQLCFKAVQYVIDKLNTRTDLFAKQGCFSKKIKRITAADLPNLFNLNWNKLEGVYLQADLESRENLREVLLELMAAIPVGKSVTLELSSTGFPYLFRSEHIRNCESLCYEASLAFRDDFYVRQLICTKQRNFIVEYIRTSKTPTPQITNLFVWQRAGIDPQVSLPGVTGKKIDDLSELKDTKDTDAVLIVGSAGTADFTSLHSTYLRYGAAWHGDSNAALFDGWLLCSAATLLRAVRHPNINQEEYLLASIEKQLILDGFWPKISTPDQTSEKQ